jgi:hypothetical protein
MSSVSLSKLNDGWLSSPSATIFLLIGRFESELPWLSPSLFLDHVRCTASVNLIWTIFLISCYWYGYGSNYSLLVSFPRHFFPYRTDRHSLLRTSLIVVVLAYYNFLVPLLYLSLYRFWRISDPVCIWSHVLSQVFPISSWFQLLLQLKVILNCFPYSRCNYSERM